MFKITTIIGIIFLTSLNMFCQELITDTSNYEAIYNLDYQRDSTDFASKQNEKMILLIGQKFSLFESYNNKYNDSLKNVLTKNNSDISITLSKALILSKKSRHKYRILKNNEKTLVYDSYFSDKFIYEDGDKLNWKITQTTKTISGFNCTLASTSFGGRDYEAWFTNEIPINDGPYKFKGLPGLIIKIEDVLKQYVFELESFKKSNEVFEFDIKNGIKVSKEDFFKSYNTFKKNFTTQLSQRGIELDESTSRETQKRVQKSRNNEIEISY